MSFDKIATAETLELKSKEVVLAGSDGKKYKFTVHELSPFELGTCFDEFSSIDHYALVYRSVRDENGKRMTIEQAKRLPSEVILEFVQAYYSLVPASDKKKSTKKKMPSA